MTSLILIGLAFLVVSFFLYTMFFTQENRERAYLKYVFLAYPFMGIDILPSILSTTLFVFVTAVFSFFFYHHRVVKSSHSSPYYILFLLLMMIIGIGLWLSEDLSSDSTTDFIQLLAVFFFAKVLIDELYSDASFRTTVLQSMKITLLFSFIFLICQFLFGPAFSIAKSQNVNVAGGIAIRYPSFFQDPQKYAQYLSASSFLMLLIPGKTTSKTSDMGLLLCAISMIALLFTGGRAGLGGWLVGLMIVLIFGNAQYRAAIIVVSLLVSFFVYYFSESIPIFKRDTLEDSYAFRYAIWQDAFDIFLAHPFFGIGLGNYANYVSVHRPDQFWINDNDITFYDHPESGYLKLLTEFGFFGCLLIVLFVLNPMYTGMKTYLRTKDFSLMVLVAALCTWLVGFYTVYSFGDIRIKILIVSIVCMLIASTNENTQSHKKNRLA